MKVFQITVTEAQLKNLFVCLDGELKRSGLENLEAVVDLRNVLVNAQPLAQEKPKDETQEGTQEELRPDK